ncbi:hypothetical protein AGMMS49949_08130 [Alphaproteobacteria bacterium]|nr:hypothetical protein AGMMS49949_08130 [Alphaproteobacteria bacterium]GHT00112.1 hypothetical protein AGMMS50296_8360 [Alphaproteobacteria bacterium]
MKIASELLRNFIVAKFFSVFKFFKKACRRLTGGRVGNSRVGLGKKQNGQP